MSRADIFGVDDHDALPWAGFVFVVDDAQAEVGGALPGATAAARESELADPYS